MGQFHQNIGRSDVKKWALVFFKYFRAKKVTCFVPTVSSRFAKVFNMVNKPLNQQKMRTH